MQDILSIERFLYYFIIVHWKLYIYVL